MNVITMRKSLRAGQYPDPQANSIDLNSSQLHHLEATVPCVKMADDSNNIVLYFPEAGAVAKTWLTHGISLHSEYRGTLLKGATDVPVYEDGTPHYVTEKGSHLPIVFEYATLAKAAQEATQKTLWVNRRPYRVRLEGYESVHEKGWPKDNQYGGRDKISLSVWDGDFKSVYLSIEPIPLKGDGGSHELNLAVANGEYDGSETLDAFLERIKQRFADRMALLNRHIEFKRFARYEPRKTLAKAIKDHNKSIDDCKVFLKLATRLRRHMRQNPGWYKKAHMPNTSHKTSTLYRYMESIKKSDRARTDADPDLRYAVEAAVSRL